MICVPVMAPTNRQAVAGMKKAFSMAEVVELRLDRVLRPDLSLLVGPGRALFWSPTGGGRRGIFEGSERDRVGLLVEAVNRGRILWTSRQARGNPDL